MLPFLDELDDAGSSPAGASGVQRRIHEAGGQKALVFVSPLGITSNKPDIFIHFHGYHANYDIDGQEAYRGNHAGSDKVAEAMVGARADLIAILPQGVAGASADRRREQGGHMAALARMGLPAFVTEILQGLAGDLGTESLSPGASRFPVTAREATRVWPMRCARRADSTITSPRSP